MILLAILSALGLIGYGALVALMAKGIHRGNPSTETPVVRQEAVIVCLVPRRWDEVA